MAESLRPPTLDLGRLPTIHRGNCRSMEISDQFPSSFTSAKPSRTSWESRKSKPAMAIAEMHQEWRGEGSPTALEPETIRAFLEKYSLYSGDSFKFFVYFIFLFAILQGRSGHTGFIVHRFKNV